MDHLAQRLCALHIYAEESTRNSKPVRADKRGVYVEILQAPLDQRPHHALGVLLITAAQQNDPSIRLLAKELRISVITTKRAYEELEREGFIVTQPGRGSFVAGKNLELIKEEHLRQLEELLAQSCRLAADCGLSLEELEEMLRLVYEGD